MHCTMTALGFGTFQYKSLCLGFIMPEIQRSPEPPIYRSIHLFMMPISGRRNHWSRDELR